MRFIAFHFMAATMALVSTAAQPGPVQGTGGQPGPLSEARKLLANPDPLVRLEAALALVQREEEQAVGVLIDLFADLPHDERRLAEKALQELAGDWSPNPALLGDDELSRKIRREAWAGWWRTLDGPALLAVFRGKAKIPLATPRLLAVRKPVGATEALLGHLSLTDDRAMKEEIVKSLKSSARAADKPAQALFDALSDPLPVRRLAAAQALAGAGGTQHWPAVRKLLADTDPEVRLGAAVALANSHDKDAVPALIKLLAELPRGQAWEAEELLHRLAGEKAPNVPWVKDNALARNKLHDAWLAWWKTHGPKLNMADLEKTQGGLGLTLVAETVSKGKALKGGKKGLAANPPLPAVAGATDRVIALDRGGQPRWQIENLNYPIDFQLLPGGRVLIAEYRSQRITERDIKGAILWEKALPGPPINVQRLANGSTFVALDPDAVGPGSSLVEVDPAGNVKPLNFQGGGPLAPALGKGKGGFIVGNDWIMAAYKMADGQIVCLTDNSDCIRLDETGKEVKRFAFAASFGFGAIDVTSKGHLLVVGNKTVNEYDLEGKIVWQAQATGQSATRLANGNTLVASQTGGVVELDNAGRIVWQYQPPAGYQAVRAR